MINTLFNRYRELGITSIVLTDGKQKTILDEQIVSNVVETISDVRSATFYAYGLAKQLCKPVLLLIDEDYISSAYTGLTEVWFQRIPVIVLAYNSKDVDASRYLERCVDTVYRITESSDTKSIVEKTACATGPVLIRIQGISIPEKKIDYTEIVLDLKKSSDSSILLYNPKPECVAEGVEYIVPSHKYGILSKYIGLLRGGKKKTLCISESCLLLDANVFNMRNFPSNFCLCIKKEDGATINRIKEWAENNNIKVLYSADNNKSSEQPKIIIY